MKCIWILQTKHLFSYLKYWHLFDGKYSKWHWTRSCNRKTVEYIFSNQHSVRILKVHIPFHISMTHSIGAWPVSWAYGLFHWSMAHFMCAWPVSKVQELFKGAYTVSLHFINMSLVLVVSAVSFPQNLHYFDVTRSHNCHRNYQ